MRKIVVLIIIAVNIMSFKVYGISARSAVLIDLKSGNDAAVAIAEHLGGRIDAFALLMNERARKIGANDTMFANPHGLDGENHYTTAYDLALITREAMKNNNFREIVSTKHTPYQ